MGGTPWSAGWKENGKTVGPGPKLEQRQMIRPRMQNGGHVGTYCPVVFVVMIP
jgi:hypothetical protein